MRAKSLDLILMDIGRRAMPNDATNHSLMQLFYSTCSDGQRLRLLNLPTRLSWARSVLAKGLCHETTNSIAGDRSFTVAAPQAHGRWAVGAPRQGSAGTVITE